METISQKDLELDSHFYDHIVPILLALLPKFDQHNQWAFGNIVVILGYINVQHDELWSVVENKIIEGRMWRYMGVREIAAAAYTMGGAGRMSKEVGEKFEEVLSKHGRALRAMDAETA